MCGIFGIIGDYNIESANEALSLIKHRGPDSSGVYIKEKLFFGHQRLSILDLSENGAQPMCSKDGNYVLIFNGEIYNHLELRKKYLGEEIFRSTTDTETLLNLIINKGISIVEELNGIFAFAFYDSLKDEIILCRDQFGVKPLYYCCSENSFSFSSEIKSFIPLNISEKISSSALLNYLSLLWSPGQLTQLKDVQKILPGTYLKFKRNNHKEFDSIVYYKPFISKINNNLTENEWIDLLEEKLLNAVKRQMLSDVPIGFFLSGGLDSSLIVAMAKKLYPKRDFECFTIKTEFKEASEEGFVDDIFYARKIAKYLNVNLNEVDSKFDFESNFDQMIWSLDEPQADIAPYYVYSISKRARELGIKVLIGGTAGDDIFSGYRRHTALDIYKYFDKLPYFIKRIIAEFSKRLNTKNPKIRRIRKLLMSLSKDKIDRMIDSYFWLESKESKKLLNDCYSNNNFDYDPKSFFRHLKNENEQISDSLNLMLLWELRSFLVDHNLNYTDKMSMACGVECRVPYLDLELVELTQTMPVKFKMKSGKTKYILKKLAERYLPKEVIYRPKTGFGAPVRNWILSDSDLFIKSKLAIDNLDKTKIFSSNNVDELIKKNSKNEIDASYTILGILAIDSWFRQFNLKKLSCSK